MTLVVPHSSTTRALRTTPEPVVTPEPESDPLIPKEAEALRDSEKAGPSKLLESDIGADASDVDNDPAPAYEVVQKERPTTAPFKMF